MNEQKVQLQGFIDVMTMQEVVKPTISPYGHVLGYDTWMRVLNREPKNTCPFTKQVMFEGMDNGQKLNRRQLVKLNRLNIDEYRDKIVRMDGFAMEFVVCSKQEFYSSALDSEYKIEVIFSIRFGTVAVSSVFAVYG